MNAANDDSTSGRFGGLELTLAGRNRLRLTHLFKQGSDTEIYRTDDPGVVVKAFNLDCDKADEISYGPYVGFSLEIAHFEDVMKTDELRALVPTFHGASIDYPRKLAWIAMEYLEGKDLRTWSAELLASGDSPETTVAAFRHAAYESLGVIDAFHRHGLILVDFKPENAIRHPSGLIRFVDLGAFFTARHRHGTQDYVYSATPDHAEVLIDACNLETGRPLSEASDIFSAGVAFFEMATGFSRLHIEAQTADEVLAHREIYLFRDTQIRDVWKAYPHLKPLLPTVETQLRERQLLFADFWHVLKAYVAEKVPGWETLPETQHDQTVLATGTTFILDQLPAHLDWLAGAIAQATTLRSIRLQRVHDLRRLLADPVPTEIAVDLLEKNSFVRSLRETMQPAPLLQELNTWDVRRDPITRLWTLAAPTACALAPEAAEFTFVKRTGSGAETDPTYTVTGDLEADDFESGKLSVAHLRGRRNAWLI